MTAFAVIVGTYEFFFEVLSKLGSPCFCYGSALFCPGYTAVYENMFLIGRDTLKLIMTFRYRSALIMH